MIPLLARQSELALKDYCFSYLKDNEGVVQDRDILVGLHSLGYRWDWDEETQKVTNVTPGAVETTSILRIDDGVEETVDLSVPDTHSYVANGLISHNTVNLPKSYTFEQYQDLFKYAYTKGLKGLTTFNPGGCGFEEHEILTTEGPKSYKTLFADAGIDLDEAAPGWYDVTLPYQALDAEGSPQDITRLFVKGITNFISLEIDGRETLHLTPEHKVMVGGAWVRVDSLREGDEVDFHDSGYSSSGTGTPTHS